MQSLFLRVCEMASAISCPSRSEILSLFRSTLRTARSFKDDNAVACAERIAIEGFREYQNLSGPSSIAAAVSEGESRLDLARKQIGLLKIYSLIKPKPRKVVMHGTVLELTGPPMVLMKIRNSVFKG